MSLGSLQDELTDPGLIFGVGRRPSSLTVLESALTLTLTFDLPVRGQQYKQRVSLQESIK